MSSDCFFFLCLFFIGRGVLLYIYVCVGVKKNYVFFFFKWKEDRVSLNFQHHRQFGNLWHDQCNKTKRDDTMLESNLIIKQRRNPNYSHPSCCDVVRTHSKWFEVSRVADRTWQGKYNYQLVVQILCTWHDYSPCKLIHIHNVILKSWFFISPPT